MEMDKQINPEIMKRREQKQALRDFAPGEGQSSNTYPERKIIKHYTDDGVGRMGTSMGHSSGIFTFPSTGIWLIMGEFLFHIGTNDESLGQVFLDVSLDGSSYTPAQQIRCGDKSDDVHNSVGLSYTMDVTNTTNNKIKFRTDSFSAQTNLRGSSGQGETMLIFIRLGDT